MSVILSSSCENQLRSEMYKRIKEDLESIRSGKSAAERVILVVPAQSTLQAEEEGFRYLGGSGFFDFAVMSGAKFRSDILNETGFPAKTAVNSIGRTMLLRRISGARKKELSSFKTVCGSEGFIDMAGDFIVQLKQNGISPEALSDIRNKIDDSAPPILAAKLSDMQLVFSDYEKAMEGKYTDSEDLLSYTTEKIKESSYVSSSVIWYYDFYSFTKREYEFLDQLAKHAAAFNAVFLAGKDKYLQGEETAEKLSKKLGIERCLLEEPEEMDQEFRVVYCSSPYSQSRTIAADILEKRRSGMSYGDMIVLTQDMEGMGENLKRVLTSFGVPVFMDEKRSMRHSLGARVISSCLDIVTTGFRRQAVLSFLKCGILPYTKDDVSLFENYVKQYKIFDKGFLKPFKYGRKQLGDERFELVEDMRKNLEELFLPFSEQLTGKGTAAEKSAVLYDFLTGKLQLPEALEKKASELEEEKYLDASQEITQSFESVAGLMDQMTELFGNDSMSNEEYADLFVSCFEDIKIGVLPQAEGKVRIGSVTRTSFSDIKALYIAGFNEGIIPSDAVGENILTEDEIAFLEGLDYCFAKSSDTLQREEMYQIERALSTDTEETVIFVCMTDFEGGALKGSPLLSEPFLAEALKKKEGDIDNSKDMSGYIQSKESAGFILPRMLRKMVYGESVPEIWKETYNEMMDTPLAKTAGEAALFSPGAGNLGSELSEELFKKGDKESYSPTQLENYSACPFKHFVFRGLSPEELSLFDVGAREAGNIYHLVLLKLSDRLTDECNKKGIEMTDPSSPWMTISEEETNEAIARIIDADKENLMDGVMESDEASVYRVSRIRKVCEVFAKYMIEQVRKGRVSEMYFERQFKDGNDFPSVKVETPFGTAVIEGQIDRVDLLKSENGEYVKIIDYKSGNKEFDRGKVEAGLDLQLMIYLEGALGLRDGLKPAGVFYYHVKDPERKEDYANVISEEISEDLAKKIAKEYALDGMVVNDSDVLSSLDEEIKGSKIDTTVFRVRKENKNIITSADMDLMRSTFKTKLKEICSGLMSGNIEIKPAFYDRKNVACKNCGYSSICLYLLNR